MQAKQESKLGYGKTVFKKLKTYPKNEKGKDPNPHEEV